MKVVVIGASGHIGTYLVPQLVKGGFDVVAITRGKSQAYVSDPMWHYVKNVYLDRSQEDFAQKIAEINGDVVVDLINFDIEDTKKMVKALKDTKLSHYLYCSSIWAHGRAEFIPEDPNALKEPLDHYGKDKYASELYLKEQYRIHGFPATIIMPGQISGPGWTIMNPQATKDNRVFQKIADGEEIVLPNFGMETLHHVHAYDVAQMFYKAITHRTNALGESFHAVAKESMTLYGYAKALYRYFHQEPKIRFLSWEKFCDYLGNEEYIDDCYHHIARSGHYSIEKAERLLEYHPKYTTLETVEEAMESYIARGIIVLKDK
ncbi:NAD-dependent epimerase/dehydratase family protein [Allocoprobacillus halotolerans]|uniref:NAD-dependent epimerase/dehydratase family protein n=1 Tax=Allocoprobacillus halotolerans TaxID=2944914 RepID=A0ABY5I508_9FIRM|nr:NAD-dependent epimerase/dehydratase family protein [Allocoprobacillus halotolerans]UTY39045.1 NAD-dependent epimerase/dehydratase family protein [Allocoprobacillus halotolerans]